MFLASSATAFVGDTRRVMLIDDDEIVAITAAACACDRRRRPSAGARGDRDPRATPRRERGGYDTYMLKEINEQPEAVRETIARQLRT